MYLAPVPMPWWLVTADTTRQYTTLMLSLRKMSLIYALDILMYSCRFCS